jgi:hypothetical protein
MAVSSAGAALRGNLEPFLWAPALSITPGGRVMGPSLPGLLIGCLDEILALVAWLRGEGQEYTRF